MPDGMSRICTDDRKAPGPLEAVASFDKLGLSQLFDCERKPATATVPQPRHHIATIANVISDNETNEGRGVFLLDGSPRAARRDGADR